MKDKIKGSLTISRPTCGDGRKYVCIQVKDVGSRVTFLEVEIGYADFTACLMGLGEAECALLPRGLNNVGKTKQTDSIHFKMPAVGFRDEEVARLEAAKNTPDGWQFDGYFGSQQSFYRVGGQAWATTSIYRWV